VASGRRAPINSSVISPDVAHRTHNPTIGPATRRRREAASDGARIAIFGGPRFRCPRPRRVDRVRLRRRTDHRRLTRCFSRCDGHHSLIVLALILRRAFRGREPAWAPSPRPRACPGLGLVLTRPGRPPPAKKPIARSTPTNHHQERMRIHRCNRRPVDNVGLAPMADRRPPLSDNNLFGCIPVGRAPGQLGPRG